VADAENAPIFTLPQALKDHLVARKSTLPTGSSPPDADRARGALDVATLAPWIAFWGWVALDSALAYRKSQAALEQSVDVESDSPEDPEIEPARHSWTLWSPGARFAMIGAPVVALLGPLLVERFTRRRKP